MMRVCDWLVVCLALASGLPAVAGFNTIGSFRWSAARHHASADASDKQQVVAKPSNLPPAIQQIVDERQEFQMNLGKAMDTLRKDMPDILRRAPDFSIYHEDISVIDPSGVQLTGLDKYKSAFAFLQTFIKFWFGSRTTLQYRLVYDYCRSSIRVSWNVVLVPKVPLGRPLYIDGISLYKLDVTSGKIIEHKIENLIINNTPVKPPYAILSILQQDLLGVRQQQPQGVPVGLVPR